MAIVFTRPLRPLLVVAAAASVALLTPTLAAAVPPPTGPRAEPSISDVQKELGKLAIKNSQIVEQFDHARVVVAKMQKKAAAAAVLSRAANAKYQHASMQFTQIVQAQYENGALGGADALLSSDSGNNYLDRLDTLDLLSTHDADVVATVTDAKTKASTAAKTAKNALADAKKERDGLKAKRDAVTKQISKYQDLLATLNAKQRAAFSHSINPSVDVSKLHIGNGPATAADRRAVQFALNQIGKPYVFGAAGPDAYDCSGLTMAAWQQGGVSLPHSAADQYNYGTHVSIDSLRPGDLIFMYSPIGHVTIYAGDGMMVSAPTEGEPVTLVSVDSFSSDIVGATRLG